MTIVLHLNGRNFAGPAVGKSRLVFFFVVIVRVLPPDVFVGRNQKARCAASRIQNTLGLLGINHLHNKVDDVPRCAELSGIALTA